METPVIPPPTDPQEKQVLDQLSLIRDKLLLLKQDRTKYVRSQDVIPLYDQTIEQVRILNEHRSTSENREENRVDRVLDSCFQLLSLFFMTIGRNNEAPAAYALTSTIRRILDHLAEAGLYSSKDLASLSRTLEKLAANISTTSTAHSPYLITRLSKRVEKCRASLDTLRGELDLLGEPLLATHEKLISLLRSISLLNTRTRFSATEVRKLQSQIQEIDSQRVDGKFLTESGDIAKGSDEVSSILEKCLRWAELVLERKGGIPENFKPIYDALVGTRNDLEKVSLTQAWSLRETDLWDFQRKLDRIDESRVNGNWLDEFGRPAELYVQRTLLYLVRRSYGYIYALMVSSEPVSEALLPIFNQLQTLKRCLIEVKDNGGVSSERELYPYSMKLHSLQNMQTDGKFIVNGDIPEGQASVTELLAECFELNYELRVAALEAEESQKAEER